MGEQRVIKALSQLIAWWDQQAQSQLELMSNEPKGSAKELAYAAAARATRQHIEDLRTAIRDVGLSL